jgi:hypothetical protein
MTPLLASGLDISESSGKVYGRFVSDPLKESGSKKRCRKMEVALKILPFGESGYDEHALETKALEKRRRGAEPARSGRSPRKNPQAHPPPFL